MQHLIAGLQRRKVYPFEASAARLDEAALPAQAGSKHASRLPSAAIRAAGHYRVRSWSAHDDHPFSSHRLALADQWVAWLRGDCAQTRTSAAR